MNSNDALMGGKGGGGFRNRPDNLRSTDTFEALLAISSSYSKLAPGGLKNVYVDDVPVEDGQGNASFKDFAVTMFDGDPTALQPVQLRLGGSAGATQVGLGLTNSYTNAPGDWKTSAITARGVNFLDLRFVVQSLYYQTKKGIGDATATIEIELRPSGSATWINPLLDVSAPAYTGQGISGFAAGIINHILREKWNAEGTSWVESNPGRLPITGKTTSAYVKELRIAVPNTGTYADKTWEVRCRLVEQDYIVSGKDGENEIRRTLQWESVAGVKSGTIGGTEGWRGLSWMQIYGKATDQINGIPEINSVLDLGRQLVPPASVWDPTTQTYTGAGWDGVTYVNAWTQCPAWQIKGLIEDDLSGVSALAPGSTMNKWDVLEASKYFAERVPDGRGGLQPRYQLNWFIEQPMQVKELVNWMAGAVGGFAWDEGDGRWRMKVERPENPVMTFTRENIVGEFVYSHTDFDTRYNDLTGVFRNEEQRYQEDRVRVFDEPSILTTGRRHTTVALVGCTNRQEALRRLELRKLTALNETRQVTFTTNRQGLLLEPLSVIAVADGDLTSDAAIRSTGRIVWMNEARTRIRVRDHLRLELGVAYSVTLTIPNPNYRPDTTTQPAHPDWRKPTVTITRNVVNTAGERGDVLELVLDSALPAETPKFAPIALSAPGLPSLPKQYRVTNVTPDENGELVAIQAVEIFTPKFVMADNVVEQVGSVALPTPVVPPPVPPTPSMFELREFETDFQKKRVLTVSWIRPATLFLDNYKLEHRYNGGPWEALGDTRETYYELADPLQGKHDFRIYTRDRRGALSLPLERSVTVDENLNLAPAAELSNPAVTVPASNAGVVASFAGAGGTFVIRTPNGEISEGAVFSVESTDGGLTITIDPATGVYTVTALTTDFGSAVLKAVYSGKTIRLRYTIAKARTGAPGAPGAPGLSTAAVVIYKRATSSPTDTPANGATYTFATGALTGTLNGWTVDIPAANGQPLWVRQASASGLGATDTINASEWGAVRQFVADGAKTAVVYIYARSAAAPAPVTGTASYTFSTGALTGTLGNGWSATIPATNGLPLWVRTAVAYGTDNTDTISAGEWSGATQLAADGAPGPAISITKSEPGDFTYVNGQLSPASQTVTFTANLSGLSGTISWSTLPNIKSGTGSTFSINASDMGAAQVVLVTATVGGVTAGSSVSKLADPSARPTPVYRQPTPPEAPDGAWWFDTVEDLHVRNGGGWQRTSTIGARAGSTLRRSNATILGDGDVVTNMGTAAFLAGQGPGATAPASAVLNSFLPAGNANRVPFSLFESGASWYISAVGGVTGGATTVSTIGGIPTLTYTSTAGAAGNFGSVKSQKFPITGGERLSCQARLSTNGLSTMTVTLRYFDASGAAIAAQPAVMPLAGIATPSQYPFAGFTDAPSNAVAAEVEAFISAMGAGVISGTISQVSVTGASSGQTVHPTFTPGPNAFDAADVSAFPSGPASANFLHSAQGVAEAGQFSRALTYYYNTLSGPATSGLTWQYRVNVGMVNGNGAGPTFYPMSGSGAGVLNVDSLGADTNEVTIRGILGSQKVEARVSLLKIFAAPNYTGGGGGGGGGTGATASQSSGFPNVPSTQTTYMVGSNELQVTAGTTTLTATVSMSYDLAGVTSASSWFEIQLERWNGSTWVALGASQVKNAYKTYDPDTGETFSSSATFTMSEAVTVTAGTVQRVRFMIRRSSGAARAASGSGNFSISA